MIRTKQVAIVITARGRIATAAQIEPSYSPVGASVHTHLICFFDPYESAPNGILIGSAVFAGLMVMTNTQPDRPRSVKTFVGIGHI